MTVDKDTRQYIITYVKRKYEWQINELKKRVDTLEKTAEKMSKVIEHLKKKKA